MSGDVFDDLEEQTEEPAIGQNYEDWWVPDEMGEHLVGLIVEVHSAPEQYTEAGKVPDPVYTILSAGKGDFDEGEALCAKTHVQILNGLEDAELGDLVNLEHKGLQRTDGGNAANTYEIGVIEEEVWQESDQAGDLEELREKYEGATGDNRRTEPYEAAGGSSGSSSGSSSGGGDDAEDFFQDIMEMQDGEMPVENAEKMLNEVRGFDVDVEELAGDLGWDVDDDTITA